MNGDNAVIEWFKYPHGLYHEQVALMCADLKAKGYFEKILPYAGTTRGRAVQWRFCR